MTSAGYIYAIKDPRKPEGANIVYVGNGYVPWESVERHLTKSSNAEVMAWATELQKDFPEGLEILGRVVAERWHGEQIPLPDVTPGITRIEWIILDYEPETDSFGANGLKRITTGTRKDYWIDRLRKEGHPLLNKHAGRPRKLGEPEIQNLNYPGVDNSNIVGS